MLKLVIGNKNYSSWSLRPWLLLTHFDIEFEEIQESLSPFEVEQRLLRYSPTARVPVLIDNELTIWDSLAICEHVSEKFLQGRGWPEDINLRARARSLTAEMHSGFSALRTELPMNCRSRRKVNYSASAAKDIARIDALWSERQGDTQKSGNWLFGDFGIADCFFAPVALRCESYGLPLSAKAECYKQKILDHAGLQAWLKAASNETEILECDEVGASR